MIAILIVLAVVVLAPYILVPLWTATMRFLLKLFDGD